MFSSLMLNIKRRGRIMIDFVSREKRANIMRGSKGQNTRPELAVRAYLRSLKIGYRLHRKDLSGRPDIAMMGRKKAIFVNGCFWHQHLAAECPISRKPASNTEFWKKKFNSNRARDARNEAALRSGGFQVLTLWECEIADGTFRSKIDRFLGKR